MVLRLGLELCKFLGVKKVLYRIEDATLVVLFVLIDMMIHIKSFVEIHF